MKRVISLILAAALAVSLLVFPAAAAEAVRFSDITDSADVRTVESLRLMGVMDGYGDGSFRPNVQLTRAQFCKMAVLAMSGEGQLGFYSALTVYPDAKPSHWASAYINMAAKGLKIISGYSDGRFYPDRTVTLGQAATILLRMLGYKDGNIGGVWPEGYLAEAARIGLLDGVDAGDGKAPVTRLQAARLFVNLLQADSVGEDGKPTGSFLSLAGLEAKEDVVLVSSFAAGPDGKETALQLASGEVYQLDGGKVSSGVLNGCRGTLVLKNGKAVTFLPDASGATGRAVTLAGTSALQFTDTAGMKYPVDSDTGVYYNGKEEKWSAVYSWLTSGTSMTVYLNDAGKAAYIVVGGGTVSNAAVVVYKNGSAAGFDSLTGGAGGYSIYKNGSPASTGDLRTYDVAVYSAATNSVRVSDVKLTGYYESCRPSPDEAAYVTVMGHEFTVLTTAQASLAAFKPGDQITLLLTEDNQVAGAVDAKTASGSALGVVKSNSGGSAEVELLCGVTIKGKADAFTASAGDLVRAVSEESGTLRLYRQAGTVGGDLDLTNRKLGSVRLAEGLTVLVYESAEGLVPADLSALSAVVPASRVTYARTDWAGKVDLILLDGGNRRDTTVYGRVEITYKNESLPSADVSDEDDKNDKDEENPNPSSTASRRVAYVSVSNGTEQIGPFRLADTRGGDTVVSGDYAAGKKDQDGPSVRLLEKVAGVPNSAWTGRTAVTVNGRSYTVPADVACWNRDAKAWVSLDTAHAYAGKADLYVEGGTVRVIEVGK